MYQDNHCNTALVISADTDDLYRVYIKCAYGNLLNFMARFKQPMTAQQQVWWHSARIIVAHLIDAVKDAKELQHTMARFLCSEDDTARTLYRELRQHLLVLLRDALHLWQPQHFSDAGWNQRLTHWEAHNQAFIRGFRERVLQAIADGCINGWLGSSVLNDLSSMARIARSLDKAFALVDEGGDTVLPRYIETIYHVNPHMQSAPRAEISQ